MKGIMYAILLVLADIWKFITNKIVFGLLSIILVIILFFSGMTYLEEQKAIFTKLNRIQTALFDNPFMHACLNCVGDYDKPYIENGKLFCTEKERIYLLCNGPECWSNPSLEEIPPIYSFEELVKREMPSGDHWISVLKTCLQLLSENRNAQ